MVAVMRTSTMSTLNCFVPVQSRLAVRRTWRLASSARVQGWAPQAAVEVALPTT